MENDKNPFAEDEKAIANEQKEHGSKLAEELKGKKIMEETEPVNIEQELIKKQKEIADLVKKKQEQRLSSEKVNIIEHKHCVQCGRVFYHPDVQIKTCLICNPQRSE